LVVRLPEFGIVFTGDLVEEGDPPQAGADAALSRWVDSLHTILEFPEAEVFVPGHGVPVDRGFVQRQLADIDGMRHRQDDTEVALPARTMPGDHDRSVPREHRLRWDSARRLRFQSRDEVSPDGAEEGRRPHTRAFDVRPALVEDPLQLIACTQIGAAVFAHGHAHAPARRPDLRGAPGLPMQRIDRAQRLRESAGASASWTAFRPV